jgi:hypothetical protein
MSYYSALQAGKSKRHPVYPENPAAAKILGRVMLVIREAIGSGPTFDTSVVIAYRVRQLPAKVMLP